MNIIESIERKYLPGFYQSRFLARKTLALSLKQKCLASPNQLSLYQLKIILKVLQQFKLLPKQIILQQKQQQLKVKIVQSSAQSTIFSLLPFAIRQFHRLKTIPKILSVAIIFGGVNYYFMRPLFMDYIEECRKVAQKNIVNLLQQCNLPTD